MARKPIFEDAPKEVRDEITKFVKDLHDAADSAELFLKMARAVTEQSFMDRTYEAVVSNVEREIIQKVLYAVHKLCNQAQMDMMIACLGLVAFVEESERESVEKMSSSLVVKLEGKPDVHFPFHI